MRFTKMHGLGNDYVYVDGFSENIDDPAALAVRIADRNRGVGGDGLILVLPADDGSDADVRMRMFNADGSEAEMCGNGIRCVCKLVHDHRLGPAPDVNPMRIMTGNGVLTLDYRLDSAGRVDAVTVDMGEPILDPADIPLDLSHLTPVDAGGATGETVSCSLEAAGLSLEVTCISMGNPHAVIYVDDEPEGWHALGRTVEVHPAFPRRVQRPLRPGRCRGHRDGLALGARQRRNTRLRHRRLCRRRRGRPHRPHRPPPHRPPPRRPRSTSSGAKPITTSTMTGPATRGLHR